MKILDKIFLEIPKSKYLQILPDFKSERAQKSTTIVLTFIALSFFGLFAINPTLSTIAKLKKELSDNEFADQQLKQKINNLSSLQQKYSLLQKDIPFVLNAIPKDPDVSLLLAQIQSVAQDNNINIKNLQNFQVELFKKQNLNTKYYSYFFSLSGEGAHDNVLAFVSSLVNMQRVINIEAFSINRNEGEKGLLQFTLRGIAYHAI